jgi:hypothetical protein
LRFIHARQQLVTLDFRESELAKANSAMQPGFHQPISQIQARNAACSWLAQQSWSIRQGC